MAVSMADVLLDLFPLPWLTFINEYCLRIRNDVNIHTRLMLFPCVLLYFVDIILTFLLNQ